MLQSRLMTVEVRRVPEAFKAVHVQPEAKRVLLLLLRFASLFDEKYAADLFGGCGREREVDHALKYASE